MQRTFAHPQAQATEIMDAAIKGQIILIGDKAVLLTPLIKKDIADFLSRTRGQVQ
jgi:hypothetical protein